MKFENKFKIPENLKEDELKTFKEQAYATFCVNYVNAIKEGLNFISYERDKDIYFSMDFTRNYLKKKIQKDEVAIPPGQLHLKKEDKKAVNNPDAIESNPLKDREDESV